MSEGLEVSSLNLFHSWPAKQVMATDAINKWVWLKAWYLKIRGVLPPKGKNKKAAPRSEEYPPYPIDRHDHSSPQRPIGAFSYLASFV